MGSQSVLFQETLYAFAKRGSGSGIGVCHDPGRNAVEEAERIELVEKRFGCRHRAGRHGGQLIEHPFRETNPIEAASFAVITLPVPTSSNACFSPTERRSKVITIAGTKPMVTSGYAKRAVS